MIEKMCPRFCDTNTARKKNLFFNVLEATWMAMKHLRISLKFGNSLHQVANVLENVSHAKHLYRNLLIILNYRIYRTDHLAAKTQIIFAGERSFCKFITPLH